MNSSDDPFEAELRALGESLHVPPPPEAMADRVLTALREPAPKRRFTTKRLVAVVAAVLVVLVAATPQGRAAVAGVLRFAGVEIEIGGAAPVPSGSPAPLPSETSAALAEARSAVAFPLVVPAVLGEPDQVRVADGGQVVSMYWDTIRLDQYDGSLREVWHKELGEPFPQQLWLGTTSGVWIPQQHGVEYLPVGGGAPVSLRLAGPTLIWQHGRVGLRLEGVPDVEEAKRIAASVR
ncbi:hypothetical protein [Herbidospora sp. NBRC 101105]|uniref:hypothetical protein n=1 Tax=Herbidospora sp. NBRC 101105 TaxID=3032195 RepID=UPI0024A2294A|nr:hypothetical protein [Herbidospora sp. NBRC 101105]GLX95753.1 hypothetical protein Hesp01_37030 [Herbidospora sp. NBRC 101105]